MQSQTQELRTRILAVRGRVRRYFLFHGICQIATYFLAGLAAAILLDYTFRLGNTERIVILAALACAVAWAVYKHVVKPLRVKITEDDLMMCVENEFPELNDHLITAIQLDRDWEEEKQFSSTILMQAVIDGIRERVKTLNFKKVAKPRNVVIAFLIVAFLGIGFGGVGIAKPELLRIGILRILNPFAEDTPKWPVNTEVVVILKGASNVIPVAGPDFQYKPDEKIRLALNLDKLSFDRETEEWRREVSDSTAAGNSPFYNDKDIINDVWMKVTIDNIVSIPKKHADKFSEQQNIIIQIPDSEITHGGNGLDWQYEETASPDKAITVDATIMVAGPVKARSWKVLKDTAYRMRVLTRNRAGEAPPAIADIYRKDPHKRSWFGSSRHVGSLQQNQNLPGIFDETVTEPVAGEQLIYVIAGDSEAPENDSDAYRLIVVEARPKVNFIKIEYTLPNYIFKDENRDGHKDTDKCTGTSVSILKNSTVLVTAHLNKPVRRALLRFRRPYRGQPESIIMEVDNNPLVKTEGDEIVDETVQSVVTCRFELKGDADMRIELDDEEGFRNKGEFGMIKIRSALDSPASAHLDIMPDNICTASARILLRSIIRDDWGLLGFRVRASLPYHKYVPNLEDIPAELAAETDAPNLNEPEDGAVIEGTLLCSVRNYQSENAPVRTTETAIWNLGQFEFEFVNKKTGNTEIRTLQLHPGDTVKFWLDPADVYEKEHKRETAKPDIYQVKVVSNTECVVELKQQMKHLYQQIDQAKGQYINISSQLKESVDPETGVPPARHNRMNQLNEFFQDSNKVIYSALIKSRRLLAGVFSNFSDETSLEDQPLAEILLMLYKKDVNELTVEHIENYEMDIKTAIVTLDEEFRSKAKYLLFVNQILIVVSDSGINQGKKDFQDLLAALNSVKQNDTELMLSKERKRAITQDFLDRREQFYQEANDNIKTCDDTTGYIINELEKIIPPSEPGDELRELLKLEKAIRQMIIDAQKNKQEEKKSE